MDCMRICSISRRCELPEHIMQFALGLRCRAPHADALTITLQGRLEARCAHGGARRRRFAQVGAARGGAAGDAGAPAPMEGVEGAAAPALTLDLPEPADVDARYAAELGPLQVGDWDSTAPGAYNRWARTGALI